MKIKYLAKIVIMFVIIFISIWMAIAIDINHCGIIGFAGETYTLTANVTTDENTCFIITADDVTLDCSEFSIIVNNTNINDINTNINVNYSNNSGIYSNMSNIILKNCDKSVQKNDKDKVALFDIIADIVAEPKKSGEDLIVKISLINFGASNEIDANLEYTVTNSDGTIARKYIKIVPVKTQTEFLEHIDTAGMTNGKYTIKVDLTYEGQTFPAHTEKIFYVGGTGLIRGLVKNINFKTSVLTIVAIGLLLGVYRKSRINKIKENENNGNDNNNDNQMH